CQIYSDLCASPRPHVQRIRPLLRLYPILFHFCYGSPPQKSPMFTGLVTDVTDVTGFWKGGGYASNLSVTTLEVIPCEAGTHPYFAPSGASRLSISETLSWQRRTTEIIEIAIT